MATRKYSTVRPVPKKRKKKTATKQAYRLKNVKTGEVITAYMAPMAMLRRMDVLRRIMYKGKLYQRLIDREASPKIRHVKRAKWPYVSDAMGVHPNQIKEAQTKLAQVGVKVSYTADGGAIIESPRHRKQLAEAMGLHDRNSYGGMYEARHKP